MRLSIIIPIYNVEKYIERCINSIFEQNLASEDYEVLLIDDETPDQSGEIAKKIAESRDNYHYIFQKNKGLGGARNTGILHAKGNYILFLDSDDWLEENSLFYFIEKELCQALDLVYFDINRCYPNGEKKDVKMSYEENRIFSGRDFILKNRLEILPLGAFYKRELLIDNRIKFVEGVYYEDVYFCLKSVLNAQRVKYVSKIVYNYYFNEQSITNKKTRIHNDKKIVDYGKAMLRILEVLNTQPKEIRERIYFLLEKYMRLWVQMIYRTSVNFTSVRNILLAMKEKGLYPFKIRQQVLEPNEKVWMWHFNTFILHKIFYKYRVLGIKICVKINKIINQWLKRKKY